MFDPRYQVPPFIPEIEIPHFFVQDPVRLLQRSLIALVPPQTEGINIVQRNLFHLTE